MSRGIKLSEWARVTVSRILKEDGAPEQAKQLGLTYAGWGKWKDESGKTVAKTVQGNLVKLSPEEASAEEENPQTNNVGADRVGDYGKGTGWFDNPNIPHNYPNGGKSEPHPDINPGTSFSGTPEQYNALSRFIHKSGGAVSALDRITLATNAALKSGDESAKWKALKLAKSVEKILPELEDDAAKSALDSMEKNNNGMPFNFDRYNDEMLADLIFIDDYLDTGDDKDVSQIYGARESAGRFDLLNRVEDLSERYGEHSDPDEENFRADVSKLRKDMEKWFSDLNQNLHPFIEEPLEADIRRGEQRGARV